MKLRKSKKGFFTDPLVDAFSFIAIVIIIVIFSVIFQLIHTSGAYDIKGAELKLDAETQLLSILRTPIDMNGYKTDIAGYIIYAKGDDKKNELLKQTLEKLLADMVKKTPIDCIDIEFDNTHARGESAGFYLGYARTDLCGIDGTVAKADLPSQNGVITVQLTLKRN
jgi:hypothetical protein